jgi:hypothetical protein
MGSTFSAIDKTFQESFRSPENSSVAALLEQHGQCPSKIYVW